MASGGAGAGRDVKDNFVPRFENTTVGYTEWRRRVKLYARKLELQGRKNEVALNVLSVLEGPSWTQCEDLDIQELEKENGLEILLKRLDRQWAYDSKVEMPTHFDAFFFKMRRKKDQSILEYTTEFHQTLRQVAKHKVDLPEEVTGWLMLKRAGLTREQEQLVQDEHRISSDPACRGTSSLPHPWTRSSACSRPLSFEKASTPWPMEATRTSVL